MTTDVVKSAAGDEPSAEVRRCGGAEVRPTSAPPHLRTSGDSDSTIDVLTLDAADLSAPDVRRSALEALENGGLVFLPRVGFPLMERERELLTDLRNFLEIGR